MYAANVLLLTDSATDLLKLNPLALSACHSLTYTLTYLRLQLVEL